MMQSNSDWLSQSLKKSYICVWPIYHAELSNTALSSDQFMSGSFICMHNVTHSSMTELLNTVLSSQTQFFHQINSWVVLSSAWVLQHICKAELLNTAHSLNQFLSKPFIYMCNVTHLSMLSCQTQLFHQINFKTWWRCCLHCNILQPQLFHQINSQEALTSLYDTFDNVKFLKQSSLIESISRHNEDAV